MPLSTGKAQRFPFCPGPVAGAFHHQPTNKMQSSLPKPHLLFAISTPKLRVPNGWWFTDKDGELKSLTP